MRSRAFVVTPVDWLTSREELNAVRRSVFIDEQKVPEALEWDDADESAYHVLAASGDGVPIGTGRMTLDCRIGRMAVMREWRGCGVGRAILAKLVAIARTQGCTDVHLHGQLHALPFYARFGFTSVGPVFEEAGIPHRMMKLKL